MQRDNTRPQSDDTLLVYRNHATRTGCCRHACDDDGDDDTPPLSGSLFDWARGLYVRTPFSRVTGRIETVECGPKTYHCRASALDIALDRRTDDSAADYESYKRCR